MKDGFFLQQARKEGTVPEEERRKQQAKKRWLFGFVFFLTVPRAPWQSVSIKAYIRRSQVKIIRTGLKSCKPQLPLTQPSLLTSRNQRTSAKSSLRTLSHPPFSTPGEVKSEEGDAIQTGTFPYF